MDKSAFEVKYVILEVMWFICTGQVQENAHREGLHQNG